MSNRSSRRPNATPGPGQNIRQMIQNAAAEARAKAETEQQQEDVGVEDLNILPMPSKQEITKGKWMQWIWVPILGVKVYGILYLAPYEEWNKGEYCVQLSLPSAENTFTLDPEIAKIIGQCLIAAQRYEFIWKEHAGSFLEKELMFDGEFDEVVDAENNKK